MQDLAFFNGHNMGTLPNVTFKVEKWNSATGSTGKIETAWFKISSIPYVIWSEQNLCKVGCFMGIPMEVDAENLSKFDYVGVKDWLQRCDQGTRSSQWNDCLLVL